MATHFVIVSLHHAHDTRKHNQPVASLIAHAHLLVRLIMTQQLEVPAFLRLRLSAVLQTSSIDSTHILRRYYTACDILYTDRAPTLLRQGVCATHEPGTQSNGNTLQAECITSKERHTALQGCFALDLRPCTAIQHTVPESSTCLPPGCKEIEACSPMLFQMVTSEIKRLR